MKVGAIENLLDECLLTEEEMALGPEEWRETMEHLDRVNLALEDEEEDEEDEDEQEEQERGGNRKKEEEECKDKDCKDIKCTEE